MNKISRGNLLFSLFGRGIFTFLDEKHKIVYEILLLSVKNNWDLETRWSCLASNLGIEYYYKNKK